ncbi:hypothetical protein ACFQ9Z_15565 [Streptomyces sp. NPDC056580]|uniref:hypothetical protein n=1 Tax=Streptomyces sp. NPDC056580 TaxID=3345872 RepID=UPI0036AFE2E0
MTSRHAAAQQAADSGTPASSPADGPRVLRGPVGMPSANAAALSADRVLSIALPWFVLTTTGSVGKTGLVAFCHIVPYVTAQAPAGRVIDRVGPNQTQQRGR